MRPKNIFLYGAGVYRMLAGAKLKIMLEQMRCSPDYAYFSSFFDDLVKARRAICSDMTQRICVE